MEIQDDIAFLRNALRYLHPDLTVSYERHCLQGGPSLFGMLEQLRQAEHMRRVILFMVACIGVMALLLMIVILVGGSSVHLVAVLFGVLCCLLVATLIYSTRWRKRYAQMRVTVVSLKRATHVICPEINKEESDRGQYNLLSVELRLIRLAEEVLKTRAECQSGHDYSPEYAAAMGYTALHAEDAFRTVFMVATEQFGLTFQKKALFESAQKRLSLIPQSAT